MTTPAIIDHALILAGMLFCIGLLGVLVRRNIIFMLISLELMLNATGLAFIAAGSFWGQADGQIMFIAVVTLGAAEVAVGLGLTLLLFKRYGNIDVDNLKQLRG
ncbi:MAG: NADH-quinone oxidoreductase subunit K [Lentisphaeria bacterium]|jgi:NADH-quinone oxidoreductase subunit K